MNSSDQCDVREAVLQQKEKRVVTVNMGTARLLVRKDWQVVRLKKSEDSEGGTERLRFACESPNTHYV